MGDKKDKKDTAMTYLILRFSTLGNVVMAVPVIDSLSRLQRNDRFVVVAEKNLRAMFHGMDNVVFHEAACPMRLSHITAMHRQLAEYKPDAVIDLQDNIYSRALCALFRLKKTPVHTIRYGRMQKLAAIYLRGADKVLPSEQERYMETLHRAGLKTDTQFTALAVNETARLHTEEKYGTKNGRRIGIAPFAKHRTNILPLRTMKKVTEHFAKSADTRVYLFGAGNIESEMLRQWSSIMPDTFCIAGQLPLEEELELMRQLDVMICMDSANQHLSSLVGLRAVSIWLGTHPRLGFYGWKQRAGDCIQTTLPCRPCTIHGTGHCRYLNFACHQIQAETIIKKAEEVLSEQKNAS